MRWFIASLLVIAAAVLVFWQWGSSPVASNDPEEENRLKGTWHVVAITGGGKEVPPEEVAEIDMRYVFDGNQLTLRFPDRPDKTTTYTLEAGNPKKITLHLSPPLRAIYEQQGNKMRLCLMVDEDPNASFPTEMASRPSPATELYTLVRR